MFLRTVTACYGGLILVPTSQTRLMVIWPLTFEPWTLNFGLWTIYSCVHMYQSCIKTVCHFVLLPCFQDVPMTSWPVTTLQCLLHSRLEEWNSMPRKQVCVVGRNNVGEGGGNKEESKKGESEVKHTCRSSCAWLFNSLNIHLFSLSLLLTTSPCTLFSLLYDCFSSLLPPLFSLCTANPAALPDGTDCFIIVDSCKAKVCPLVSCVHV